MDSKATVKIEFSVYNSKIYKADMWINYLPEDGEYGLDVRVREFFEGSFKEAYNNYLQRIEEATKEERVKEKEKSERAELRRLKEKYEGSAK